MNIPIDVNVFCALELCGRSKSLIINPINEQVTHIVVVGKEFPGIERLVPVSYILNSTPNSIQLRCDRADFSDMEQFIETDFITERHLETVLPYASPYLVWPYSLYDEEPIPIQHEHIPTGEIAIHRGAPVYAKDGKVGQVDEFLVDPQNDIITHLVLREGHLWGKKDVTIPLSEIDEIMEDEIDLKLDKKSIGQLPAIPVNRKWS